MTLFGHKSSYVKHICIDCKKTSWLNDKNIVTYFKYINGFRIQESTCIICSEKQHKERVANGWQIDELD